MSDSTDMRDPLEAELESLRPVELPPEMFDRIGLALARPRRRLWLIPATAAAAAIVLAMVWRVFVREIPVGPTSIAATVPAMATSERNDDRPALATYRRALAGSPDALDKLLDRQADRVLPGGARVTASSRAGLFP